MDLREIYLPRPADGHKGDFGYLLVAAGSEMYSGSPIFNCLAALRAGADLTTAVGHRRAMDAAAGYAPDLITYPLAGEFCPGDVDEVLELSAKFDALLIGGGMERSEKSHAAIRELIRAIDLPLVIDAEAIRAVAAEPGVLAGKRAVLTPNAPEFACLAGEMPAADMTKRQEQVSALASRLEAAVALKGSVDVISDGERILVNRTGSPYMSKGGFGDTLAGICGALLARGEDPLVAAEAACYINGKAGEIAGRRMGESLLASDLITCLPQVISGESVVEAEEINSK